MFAVHCAKGFLVIVIQLLSHAWFFEILWTTACQASLSFTISLTMFKLMSIESVILSNHLILCCLLLFMPSVFPSIRVFFNEFASSHQVIKVLEPQLQHQFFQWIIKVIFFRIDWFDLAISRTIPRNSQESFLTQFKSISSLVLSLLDGPTFTFIHDYWKSHSFDYMDIYQQSYVSAFEQAV